MGGLSRKRRGRNRSPAVVAHTSPHTTLNVIATHQPIFDRIEPCTVYFTHFVLQPSISQQSRGETEMPEDIKPRGALEAGTEKACWRKRTRKGEGMRNDNQRREKIAPASTKSARER